MRSGSWSRAAAVAAAVLLPAVAGAQTTDLVFGGWSWRTHDPGSRPAGFAGAYVAVADSVRTVSVNPAGLALIPKAELAAGTASGWVGLGYSLRRLSATPTPVASPSPTTRPTQPANPVPCSPPGQSRPWAIALFAEQAVVQDNQVEAVRGPGLSETATLSSTVEQVGGGLAKGLTSWLDLGVSLAWSHLRLEGSTSQRDLAGDELARVTLGGDANKARAIAGLLMTFGSPRDPTAVRLGVAYHRDLMTWSMERTAIDRVRGVVTSGPSRIDVTEPPVLAGGIAWRMSDTWLVSGELDYIFYDEVRRTLERNTDAATAASFHLVNGVEPRLGIEMMRPSPTGGYFKLRAGIRRETSGRLGYDGSDLALRQAFESPAAAFRAAVGASLLGEFYENAFRFDIDISQVVVQRVTSLGAAGRRRLSVGLTLRM
jgi:hypothetical protein